MKKLYLLLTALLLCRFLTAQVIISGTAKHYDRPYITVWKQSSYELPFNKDTIYLDNKNFNFKLETNQIAYINIEFFQKVGSRTIILTSFFASPGDSIHLDLDFSKYSEDGERVFCQFGGTNASGHDLYYAYRYYPLGHHLARFRDITRSGENAASTYKEFIAEMETMIQPYKDLLQQGEIDKVYYKAVTDEIKSGIFYLIISDFYREDKQIAFKADMKAERTLFVNDLFQYLPVLEAGDLLTDLKVGYFSTYLRHQEMIKNGRAYFSEIHDTLIIIGKREYKITNNFAPLLQVKPEKLQEYLFAHWLFTFYRIMIGMTDQYDEVFSFFKAKYPDSEYIPTLENARIENAKILAAHNKPTPGSVAPARYFPLWNPTVIDDTGVMKDFTFKNDIVNLKKGIYYVDIWATWCQPCLAEMQYNYETDSLLEANKIERLYISIDEPDNHTKWLSKIYEYHLGGYHILAGEKLKLLLSQQFGGGGDGTMMVPRYLFIKDGKIVNKSAAHPSEFQQLVIQVEQLGKM